MKFSDAGLPNDLLDNVFSLRFRRSRLSSFEEGQDPTHHSGVNTHAEEFGALQKLGKPIRCFVSFSFWDSNIFAFTHHKT